MKPTLAIGLIFASLLTPSTATAQRDVPALDSGLAALVVHAVFDSLRSHGSGPDLHWIASDAATFTALSGVAATRQIMLLSPRDTVVLCPGSSSGLPESRGLPEGYLVLLSTRTDSGRVYLNAQADCYVISPRHTRPQRYKEGTSWEVAKDERGWRIVRLYMRWAT